MSQNITSPELINYLKNDRKHTNLWTYLSRIGLLINNPKPIIFASLPNPSLSIQGLIVCVIDSSVNKFGASVKGGGIFTVLAWCTGIDWIVIGSSTGFIPTVGGATHAILSASHIDTLVDTVIRGDLLVGNLTSLWSRLPIGPLPSYLRSNGLDALWSTLLAADLSGIVSIPNGGNGTATPAIIAGLGILITGIWPSQTIALINTPIATVTTPVTVQANVLTDQNLMAKIILAGSLNVVNRTLKGFCAGVYTTQAAQIPTLTFKLKLGSLTLATFTSSVSAAGASNIPWNLTYYASVVTNGATSTLEVHGFLGIDLGASGTVSITAFADSNIATVSNVDLTVDETLQITVAFSTQPVATFNQCVQRQLVTEIIGL